MPTNRALKQNCGIEVKLREKVRERERERESEREMMRGREIVPGERKRQRNYDGAKNEENEKVFG
jgi:hypothetical protein